MGYFEDLTYLSLTYSYYINNFGLGIGPTLGEKRFSGPYTAAPTRQEFINRVGFNFIVDYYPFKSLNLSRFNPYLFYNFHYKFKKILEAYDLTKKENVDYPRTYLLDNLIGMGCKIKLVNSFYCYSALGAGIYIMLKAYNNQSNFVFNLVLTAGYDF